MKTFSEEMISDARKHFIEGNYGFAEPILQQLLLQNTRNPEVYQMLATIYYDKGQFSKAIKTFKRALEIDPTYTDASVGLSIILNDLGRYDEGKQVFLEAQSILDRSKGKEDPQANERLASKHEELADMYYQYKRHKESLEQLQKALSLSSRKAELTLRIAETFVNLGQNQRAIKELRATLRDYPHFIPARLKLGVILYDSNNVADAVEQWENILVRDPEHVEAHKLLKMAHAAGITSLGL